MRELIILGRGQSWKDCPFDAECWAVAHVLDLPETNNRYGQIHKVFAFDDDSLLLRKLIRKAKKFNIPLVSTQKYATEKYPFEDIVKEFGYSYFKPTVSYMIAYAIYKGYERIRLYGIDQGPEWEHLVNKPYVMFWLGVATGRKVKWELSKFSILLETMGDLMRKYVIELKAKAKILKQYMENQS